MNILRRTNQGGSVANFILVGLVLLISLSGALFYLKNYGIEARNNQTEVAQIDSETQEVAQETYNEAKESNGTVSDDEDSSTSQSVELPQTGISDFSNLFVIFLLAVSFVYYARSAILVRKTF